MHMHTRTIRSIAISTSTILLAAVVGVAQPALAQGDNQTGLVLNFTKWITTTPGDPYMQGVVTGEGIVNDPGPYNFAGQVLVRNSTQLGDKLGDSCLAPLCGDITQLEALYEVVSGDHSFRAYLQGAYDSLTNKARLDGHVLGGWLQGQAVHVEFAVNNCPEPNAAGGSCYDGTIRITPGDLAQEGAILAGPQLSGQARDAWYLDHAARSQTPLAHGSTIATVTDRWYLDPTFGAGTQPVSGDR
jgi:hypothetical protein